MENKLETLQDKLKKIIDNSYSDFKKKITIGKIPTTNEITIQIYFAFELMTKGKMLEEKGEYEFTICLEKYLGRIRTAKTDGNARCDILLTLKKHAGKGKECKAAIEMKCFRKREKYENSKTTTDNRFNVLADIENLEHYNADLKYAIVYTDYIVYPHSVKDVKFDISAGKKTELFPITYSLGTISLKNEYEFKWDEEHKNNTTHYFLNLKVN